MSDSHDGRQGPVLGRERWTIKELDARADEVWGRGNWVTCPWCLDSLGEPSRHHISFHNDSRRG